MIKKIFFLLIFLFFSFSVFGDTSENVSNINEINFESQCHVYENCKIFINVSDNNCGFYKDLLLNIYLNTEDFLYNTTNYDNDYGCVYEVYPFNTSIEGRYSVDILYVDSENNKVFYSSVLEVLPEREYDDFIINGDYKIILNESIEELNLESNKKYSFDLRFNNTGKINYIKIKSVNSNPSLDLFFNNQNKYEYDYLMKRGENYITYYIDSKELDINRIYYLNISLNYGDNILIKQIKIFPKPESNSLRDISYLDKVLFDFSNVSNTNKSFKVKHLLIFLIMFTFFGLLLFIINRLNRN